MVTSIAPCDLDPSCPTDERTTPPRASPLPGRTCGNETNGNQTDIPTDFIERIQRGVIEIHTFAIRHIDVRADLNAFQTEVEHASTQFENRLCRHTTHDINKEESISGANV